MPIRTVPTGYNWVQNVTYDCAGRHSSLQYWEEPSTEVYDGVEDLERSGQLASVSWSNDTYYTTGGMTYSYSATHNNGQITQAVDTVSGETITYQYDLLKRLVSASATPTSGSTSAPWTETFQYDGFGNLTAKVLNGTSTPIPVNAATNQLTNAYYDANGNMTSGAGASFTYDASNRIATVSGISGGTETYQYAPNNKRINRAVSSGSQRVDVLRREGREAGRVLAVRAEGQQRQLVRDFSPLRTSVWFGGKLVYENGPVNLDRLGTNHAQSAQFLPYGDEITSTSNDRTKFATYTRDSYTGLDYADQRFYASTYGRFSTPDPYKASGGPNDPGSWNRYSYVDGDPVNRLDPRGLLYNFGCEDEDDYAEDGGSEEGCIDNAFFSDFGGPVNGPYYYQPQKNPSKTGQGGGSSTPSPSYAQNVACQNAVSSYGQSLTTQITGQILTGLNVYNLAKVAYTTYQVASNPSLLTALAAGGLSSGGTISLAVLVGSVVATSAYAISLPLSNWVTNAIIQPIVTAGVTAAVNVYTQSLQNSCNTMYPVTP